jgi:hypothetical protein
MVTRNRFGAEERAARSRLAQLLHDRDVIQGSVVSMARRCGKVGCRCNQGEKHVSLYLSVKIAGKRRMVYIPEDLEDEVRRRVQSYREVERLTELVSDACLGRILEQKREKRGDG